MATALAAVTLIGGGISAYGQYKEGQAIKEQSEFNAKLAEEEALLATQKGVLNEFRQRKHLQIAIGEQTAQFAKAGVQFTGSPLDVMADSIANAELEIAIDQFNIRSEARLKRSEAERGRFAGREATKLANIKALKTLLTMGTTVAGLKIGGKTQKIGK
jgi:hypothetical protein